VKEVVKEMGLNTEFEVIRDIMKIMEYPILTTPGLVLNGKLVSSGRALTKAEVINFINKSNK
jgi:hypothetical protein